MDGREPGNIIGYTCGKNIDLVEQFECCKEKGCKCKGFKQEDGYRKCKLPFTDEFGDTCGECMKQITPDIIKQNLYELLPEYFNHARI